MPASKAEQVLDALKALLETVPDAVVQRNSVLPEKIPAGGLIIVRDGDPGEPEQALGSFGTTYYQHAVKIEVYVERAMTPFGMQRLTACSRRSAMRWSSIQPSAASPSA